MCVVVPKVVCNNFDDKYYFIPVSEILVTHLTFTPYKDNTLNITYIAHIIKTNTYNHMCTSLYTLIFMTGLSSSLMIVCIA